MAFLTGPSSLSSTPLPSTFCFSSLSSKPLPSMVCFSSVASTPLPSVVCSSSLSSKPLPSMVFSLASLSLLSSPSPLSSLSSPSSPSVVAVHATPLLHSSTSTGSGGEEELYKDEEGGEMTVFTPKRPYLGKCIRNVKIVGDDAPGETWHMVFSTQGKVAYREGQSIGIVPPGVDKRGNPEKLRLYSIASSAPGDFGDYKTVSLCVKRLVYQNEKGETIKGVCSNHLCNLKPGDGVKITGPVGKEMLMPEDPNATIIMLATGTGIAPFRSFLWRIFFQKHQDYKFSGLAWLFHGVPSVSTQLYRHEFEKIRAKFPNNFRLDYAVSRSERNAKGEAMYIQTRMADYAEELWSLLKKDNTYTFICGLKAMEKGIDDIITSLAARDGIEWRVYKRELKKKHRWNVETS